jgi:hypothetical protein
VRNYANIEPSEYDLERRYSLSSGQPVKGWPFFVVAMA